MESDHAAIDRFVKTWVAELGKAVEMFSGEVPAIRHTQASAPFVTEEGAVWVKQAFTDGGSFDTWVGAPEASWRNLGGALGEGTPESLCSTYFEIVNQAQQGSTNAMNSAFARAMRVAKPETYLTASFDPADFVIFDIELVSADIPALTLAVELRASEVLAVTFSMDTDADAASSEAAARSILSNLLALELPVAVSVGRGEVEMKRALAAGPGTVIALDQESSDPVALLVHGRVVARGEMVLVKGNYGFRVKQILNRQDRLAMCRG